MGSLREHVRPGSNTDYTVVSPTLRVGPAKPADGGPGDTVPLTVGPSGEDNPLLPLGLDSHRYRCCGNGVVANVAEWLGLRLLASMEPVPASKESP